MQVPGPQSRYFGYVLPLVAVVSLGKTWAETCSGLPDWALGRSEDLSTCPPRWEQRRPVAEKMLSSLVRVLRPQVEVGHETVQLSEIGRPLTLLWR